MAGVLGYDIEINQNETWSQSFWFFGPDPSGAGDVISQVPVNLTGCAVAFRVRQSQNVNSTSLLSLAVSSGIVLSAGTTNPGPTLPSNPNGYTVTITPTQAAGFQPGQYYYDVMVTFPGGVQTYYESGNFTVLATVAR